MVSSVPPPGDEAAVPLEGDTLVLHAGQGLAGDMFTAALLNLGLSAHVVREALDAAHLSDVGLRVTGGFHGPFAGTEACFVDGAGRPLEKPVAEDRAPTVAPRARRAARSRRVRREGRAQEQAQAVLTAVPVEGSAEGPAEVSIDPLEKPRAVGRWLDDEMASAPALLAHLSGTDLAPFTAALALRIVRRVLHTRAELLGQSVEAVALPGRAGLDLLCDAISAAALTATLKPAVVLTTPLAVSLAPTTWSGMEVEGPCPFAMAAAGHLPTRIIDRPFSPTTPTGAAIAWALRAQPIGDAAVRSRHRGIGLGSLRPTGALNALIVHVADVALDESTAI